MLLTFTINFTGFSQTDSVCLDTNNVRALYWSFGSMFWDLQGNARYEIPKNSGNTSIFANGLWIGGLDNSGQLHFAGERFRQNGADFFPGPIMDSAYYIPTQSSWDKIWKINRNDIIYHAQHFSDLGYIMPQSISSWPGNGDTTIGQQFYLAPYNDVNNNLIYDPQNGDFPIISGDQAVFFIINDAKGNHTESNGTKLGIEIHGMAYAFNIPSDNAFYNTTFLNYKIFNRSSNDYHDIYIGNFTDIDIGYASDDYIACDVQRSSYFGYNYCSIDGYGQPWAYGANPPAQSVTFLGSLMPSDGIDNPINIDYGINGYGFGDNIVDNERYGLCRFIYFNNGSCTDICDPQNAMQHYNYLKGFWKDGLPLSYGGTGHNTLGINIPCRFMFPGKSDSLHWGTNYQIPTPENWAEIDTLYGTFYIDTLIECQDTIIVNDTVNYLLSYNNPPGDRRGVGSVGPLTLQAGEIQEYDIAFVWGQNISKSLGKYDQLLANIDTIRKYFVLGKTPTGQPFETFVSENTLHSNNLLIYPNPTKTTLTIESNSVTKQTFEILNIVGQSVYTSTIDKFVTIDVSRFPTGIYLVKINSGTSTTIKKFIKE